MLESLIAIFVAKDSWEYEVLVIDNASSDDTASTVFRVAHKYPSMNVRYIYEGAIGLHNARHRGAQEARGEILLYLDDDVVVDPSWLDAVIETFETTDAVLVGGKILPEYEVEPARWVDSFFQKTKEGQSLGVLSLIDFGDVIKEINPYYVWGCNFSVKKEVVIAAGGFAPDSLPTEQIMFRGDGEARVSEFVKHAGLKAFYSPKATVRHFIPKERLTLEYFCQRMYREGIGSSFKDIKVAGGIQNPIGMQVNNAFRLGYLHHRQEVLKNDDLLAWILKSSYMGDDGLLSKKGISQ